MSRLILLLVVLACVACVGYAALVIVRGVAEAGRAQVADAQPKGRIMRQLSFVLLVALILYVSVWGGA